MATRTEIAKALTRFRDQEFSGGVASEVVAEAESHFDGTFPADFVEFLVTYGAGSVSSEQFIGLGGAAHLDIREIARDLRKPSTHADFPRTLVPIHGDGFGNFDCIDLEASTTEASRVVAWVHDDHDNTQEVLAESFWDWFADMLDMVAELDDEDGL